MQLPGKVKITISILKSHVSNQTELAADKINTRVLKIISVYTFSVRVSNELGAGNPKSAVFSVVVVTVLSAVLHPVGAHLGGHPLLPGLRQLHHHRR